jgi:hypothetical protein
LSDFDGAFEQNINKAHEKVENQAKITMPEVAKGQKSIKDFLKK